MGRRWLGLRGQSIEVTPGHQGYFPRQVILGRDRKCKRWQSRKVCWVVRLRRQREFGLLRNFMSLRRWHCGPFRRHNEPHNSPADARNPAKRLAASLHPSSGYTCAANGCKQTYGRSATDAVLRQQITRGSSDVRLRFCSAATRPGPSLVTRSSSYRSDPAATHSDDSHGVMGDRRGDDRSGRLPGQEGGDLPDRPGASGGRRPAGQRLIAGPLCLWRESTGGLRSSPAGGGRWAGPAGRAWTS
jgi:hypothetical protein